MRGVSAQISHKTPSHYIALGFTNGVIKIVDSSTLKDLSAEVLDGSDGTVKTNYAHFDICSAGSIRKLLFHAESRHLAAYDSENRVSLLALEPTAVSSREQWIHVGSMKSHAKAIVGLEFFNENGRLVLASVGQDRCMVKYDVRESSFANGLKLLV